MIHSTLKVGCRAPRGLPAAFNAVFGLMLGAALFAAAAPARAADAPKGPQISRSIAKEMIAAQKALQAGHFQDGLKDLQEAEAKSSLTPFDHKTIDDLKAYAYVKLGNMKAAEQSFEAALATGACSAEDKARFTRAVFQLAYNGHEYAKAIQYGKLLAGAGSDNPDIYAIVGQSYYLTKDCKNAGIWLDKAIAVSRKAGKPPQEGYYQIKLRCAFEANNVAAEISGYIDLVRLTNKPEYWNPLLRLVRQDEREDRNLLMIYRIMYNTKSMTVGSDYVEMAQLLGDAGLPEEAASVVQTALTAGVITADQKDRVNRLLKAMHDRAATDRKGIPQFIKEAQKSPTGELDVKLGEVYFGMGDYQSALQAINRGLKKGAVKHLGEAYVYLGLSEQQLKDIPDAKKAFEQLKSVPDAKPRIVKLWDLYAGQLT